MRITADTNLLLRAVSGDDPEQGRLANEGLGRADVVAVTLPALRKFARGLTSGYDVRRLDVATAIEYIVGADNVATDLAAVEAGVALLRTGSDFAGGVIAHEGRKLGVEVFVSFDRRAVQRVATDGRPARQPG